MTGESLVYCEGYYDRAFWKGCLEHLGCENLFEPGGTVKDPWGLRVSEGHFGFLNQRREFVRVVPCHGKEQILPAVRNRLLQRVTKHAEHIVINWDADTFEVGTPEEASPNDRLRDILGSMQEGATPNAVGDYQLEGEPTTTISLVLWSTPDAPSAGGPAKQTLERLCCAALREVYPVRSDAVARWLATLEGGPTDNPKSFSWSYMAGWFPDRGCEAFLEQLWKDVAVAQALQDRLKRTGAWRVVQELVGP
jgi:hypothetical protein